MHETLNYLLSELRSAWRFRWLALSAAWVACLAGWVYVSAMPDRYEATARVYVDTTSQLRQILGNQIVEPDLDSQLNFVREAMLGRVQLEKIARSTDLALGAHSEEELNAVIDRLRSRINISISGNQRGRPRDTVYTIRYSDVDRPVALNVVETMLDTFVEDTLGTRRQGSENAREFIELQVREYEQRLADAEERLAAFRREHADVLPGQQGGYFQRLQAETAALEEVEQQLELAESRRDRMREQLRGDRPTEASGQGEPAPNSLEARIREQETRLEEMLLRYTDRHPDVIAARETLERLRTQLEEQRAAVAAGGGPAPADNPVYQALQISLNEVEVEIASLTADRSRRQARVARLRGLIEEVPEVEAQLARLNRDYDVVNAQYQALLRSLETERLTREASESDQIDFRVIDPPAVPTSPSGPQRPILLLGVLFAGLGGGGGLAFLLAQVRPVFTGPKELRDLTGLPVVGVVSLTSPQLHRIKRRAELMTFALGCLALLGVFATVYAYEVAGPGLRAMLS